MSEIWNDLTAYFGANMWLFQIFILLFAGLAITWLEGVIYRRLLPHIEKTKNFWDDAMLKALHKPLLFYIWLAILSFIIPILLREMGFELAITGYFGRIRILIFVLALFWFAFRFVRYAEQISTQQVEMGIKVRDRMTIHAVAQICRVIVIIIAILAVMQALGIPITGLVAFGGVGALAVGFAAKDTLANFLGGMMIFWDRPFSVGEWISSPDKLIEGTVEQIGWRLTRIRGFDRRPIYVPNSLFSTIVMVNPSRMTNRRIKTTIGVRYQDAPKVGVILNDIEKMLRNHPEIDTHQTLMVKLFQFGPSSLNFFIYTYTKTTKWVKFQSIQQDVFLKAIEIITQHGAECAFPNSTVHIPEGLVIHQAKGEDVSEHKNN